MVTVSELIEFMNFILQKNEDGLAILVGAAPAPTALELYEMRSGGQVDYGVRIDGGEGVPHAQSALESVEGIEEIISDAGGWKVIHLAFQEFRKEFPEQYKFIENYSLFIRPGGIIRDGAGGMGAALGRKYKGVTQKTLRRRYKRIMRTVAQYILACGWSDGYNLMYRPPKKPREN